MAKMDYWKLAQMARWGFCVLFVSLALLGFYAILTGRFIHIITVLGCLSTAYTIAKHW